MQVGQLATQFLDMVGFHPALIVDENGIKQEHIQKLSYKLTHLYYKF